MTFAVTFGTIAATAAASLGTAASVAAGVAGGIAGGALGGAAIGAVGSAITGGDVGRGALMGAGTGAIGGGVAGGLGAAGSVAADAATAGTGAGTGAGAAEGIANATGKALTPAFESQGATMGANAAEGLGNAGAGAAKLALTPPSLTNLAPEASAGVASESSPIITKVGQMWNGLSDNAKTLIPVGVGGGAMMLMNSGTPVNNAQPPDSMPPVQLHWADTPQPTHNVYKPRYADGGITSLAPQSQIPNPPQYATATQVPVNREVIDADYDATIDPLSGNITNLAAGGITGLLKGQGDGLSDSIPATIEGQKPAALGTGEFVVSSDVVSALGGGDTDAGAQRLYAMMDRIRQQAHGHKQQIQPVSDRVLPA